MIDLNLLQKLSGHAHIEEKSDFFDMKSMLKTLLDACPTCRALSEAFEAGADEYYEVGKEEGYDTGYDDGYDDGFDAGLADAEEPKS